MEPTKPLGTIKDMATGTLARGVTVPGRLAARAFGVAKGAATVGKQIADDVRSRGPQQPAAPGAPDDQEPEVDVSQPVNVVAELGLDPAPVDESAAASDADDTVTEIDAHADPTAVDVTPADIADQVGTHPDVT